MTRISIGVFAVLLSFAGLAQAGEWSLMDSDKDIQVPMGCFSAQSPKDDIYAEKQNNCRLIAIDMAKTKEVFAYRAGYNIDRHRCNGDGADQMYASTCLIKLK